MSRQHSDDQRGALEALIVKWRETRAHTYASENADLYRGFDNGCQRCADDLAAALSGSSTAPGEAVTMANVGIATPASVVATSQEAPICAACAGKGWVSPEDAERGIQESGRMFTAGYEHRKQHFEAAPASAVAVPQDESRWLTIRQALHAADLNDGQKLIAIGAILNSREPLTEAQIARTHELAKKHGWEAR